MSGSGSWILGLRINAFLALIVAAFVASLLAPGEPATKIARVAQVFGSTAHSPFRSPF